MLVHGVRNIGCFETWVSVIKCWLCFHVCECVCVCVCVCVSFVLFSIGEDVINIHGAVATARGRGRFGHGPTQRRA